MITVGKDGYVQYKKDDKRSKFRSHSFAINGITAFHYSSTNKLIYTCGADGSLFVLGVGDKASQQINTWKDIEKIYIKNVDTMSHLCHKKAKIRRKHSRQG